MMKALGLALALMMGGAVAMTPTAQAASFAVPELTAASAVELVAKKKKCKKGTVYSKKKKKCVAKKKADKEPDKKADKKPPAKKK